MYWSMKHLEKDLFESAKCSVDPANYLVNPTKLLNWLEKNSLIGKI